MRQQMKPDTGLRRKRTAPARTENLHGQAKHVSEIKRGSLSGFLRMTLAVWTRLELATSCVTGRRSNQLNYHPLNFESQFRHIMLCLSICFFCGAYFFSIPINQSLLSKVHVLKYPSNRQNFPNFALWWFLSFRENFMFDISAPKNT